MALIVCKKCGKQISDKAKTCPYCGEIIKEELSSTESVKKCEECGAEIPTGADSCPNCGCPIDNVEKETNIEDKITTSQKKKWLIPLIVLIVVIAVATLVLGGGDDSKTSGTEENSNKIETESPKEDEADAIAKYKWIQERSAGTDMEFVMNEDAINFIDAHPDFFPGSSKNEGAMSDYLDYEVDYQHIAKSPSKYSNQFIYVDGTVVDCSEVEGDYGTITFLQVTDYYGNNYCLYYLGALENVFENEEVWGYALPFGMVTFENIGGSYTEAVIGAAGYIYTYADAFSE